MRSSYHEAHAVERDGTVTTSPNLAPHVRALIEKISRSAYMIDQHRQGIALNQQRIFEAQAELQRIEGGR